MTENLKVTVLMPVYNGEKYLAEAIESILNQTFDGFEFLIINDGSTDRSVEIIEAYDDRRIRLVQNKSNLKLIATLNKGLELAGGEYIARMDCDDVSMPGRLEKQVEFMDRNPHVGILGSGFQLINGSSEKSSKPILFPSEHAFIRWSLFFYCPIAHPTVMMRKKVILGVGGYTSELIHGREKYSGEDYDLWRRASKVTEISNLQEELLLLRKHETNVTKTYLEEHLKNAAKVSQLMISESLHEGIPLELVKDLRMQECKSVKDAVQVSSLIHKLYNAHIRCDKLSSYERKLVCKDAARRMFSLGRPFIRDFHAWRIILNSIYLNPYLLVDLVRIFIAYMINKVPFPMSGRT